MTEADSDPLRLVGTTLDGKYEVLRLAGEGGTAFVYRATHRLWNRPVALKIFKDVHRSGGEGGDAADQASKRLDALLTRLAQEAKVLAELSERSASIVQARDIGEFMAPDGTRMPFMVLEWLDGISFDAVLKRERLEGRALRSLSQAVALLEPVAEGLALAHRVGIAHRDINPSNLFLVGDLETPIVKILNFGIAKVVADAQKDVQERASNSTETTSSGNATSFTPRYGTPEQFSRRFGSTGPWTDVFALALVLAETVTGRVALEGGDDEQLAFSSANPALRPSPRTLGLALSDAAENVFLRALAVRPEDRYETVGEFWRALRAALDLEPSRWAPTVPRAVSSRPSRPASGGNGARARERPAALPAKAAEGHGRLALAGSALLVVGFIAAGALMIAARRSDQARRVALGSAASAATAFASAAPSASAADPGCPGNMVAIPGGKFFMGSDDAAALETERPVHKVLLAPFCIDRFEVTTAEYRACSDEGECLRASEVNNWNGITPTEKKAYDPQCNIRDPAARDRHPINCVDWNQAVAFCKVRAKRLPSEAEWEFAARGPDGRKYPWGDDPPSPKRLNACGKECLEWGRKNRVPVTAMYDLDDGFATTAPVGSFKDGASRYGVEDVVGNVWEWVSDWYAEYGAVESVNPVGPPDGEARVIRGGAWNGAYPAWVRPTFRYRDSPGKTSYGIGFRCAKSL